MFFEINYLHGVPLFIGTRLIGIDNLSKARLKFLCKIKAVVVEILDKK